MKTAERLRDTIAARPIDTGLYAAKHAGRNKVIRWTPELARAAPA